MKKRFLNVWILFVFVLILLPIRAQAADTGISSYDFEDTRFGSHMLYYYDTNYDNLLSESERAAVTSLNIVNSTFTSLKGIEYFPNLEELFCNYNYLTELDVSGNPKLQYLFCVGNELTSLNLTGCTQLETLYCADNALTSIDTSTNTSLRLFDCGYNQLTKQDLTKNVNLESFTAADNKLTSLDLSNNTKLNLLICSGNQLATLDISKTALVFNERWATELGNQRNGQEITVKMTAKQKADFDANYAGKEDNTNVKTVTSFSGITATITSQPMSQTIMEGNSATFRVDATGVQSYQWQWRSSSSGTWANCSASTAGYNTSTLKPVATAARNGYQYRCIIKDAAGNTLTSSTVTLTVKAQTLTIISQPTSLVVHDNCLVTLTIKATAAVSYRWQRRESANDSWQDYKTGTDSIEFLAYSFMNGFQHRCIVSDAQGNTLSSRIDTLTVKPRPRVTSDPRDITVTEGLTAAFSIEAAGLGLHYEWKWAPDAFTGFTPCSSNMEGYNTPTLKVPATAARNGYQYRCDVYDDDGYSDSSSPAILTVTKEKLAFTSQPVSQSVVSGSSASFKAIANSMASSYRWQWRASSSGTWANCSSSTAGYNTATLKPVGTAARNGYQYRCMVKDSVGTTVYSNTVTLKVLAIATQPASQSVSTGSSAAFKVVATNAASYQWQWRSSSSGTWANCSSSTAGYNTATLKPVGTAARNGYQYRCVIKDSAGHSVTSNTVTLTVKSGLTITAQPVSQTAEQDSFAAFTVSASGSGLTYQWQWRTGSTGTWANCSSATAGYNKATLNPVATAARNGYQYRCTVKDSAGNSVTSNTVTLTVNMGLAITSQPVSQTVSTGSSASFKVTATGASSYQWQWRSSSSGTWANCSSATVGYNTSNLKPVGTAARNGYQYRCIVKGASGSVTSNTVTLTVKAALSITSQPVSQAAAQDSFASFTVSASGSGLTYQWQWRTGSTGTWANCSSATAGYNKATLNPVATAARNGYQYRCIVKDSSGASVTSSTVTLTVH